MYKPVSLTIFAIALPLHFAEAKPVLKVLTWPGYADSDTVSEFSKKFDAEVETTIISSDDELWDAMQQPDTSFDVLAVNTAELQRYIDAKLVQPIQLSKISNHKKQQAQFQSLNSISGLTRRQAIYAIPYAYSEMGLIYNKDIVKTPPTSMNILWDERYKGKVLAFNGSAHNFSLTALTLGIKNPFQLNNNQFGDVVKKVAALRKNVYNYYNLPEEAVDIYKAHPIALVYANYGTQQVKLLQQAGAHIGYTIPKEGALAWLDCWAIGSKSTQKKLAEQWINFTLEPAISQRLSDRYDLSNTITQAAQKEAKGKLIWLRPVEDANKRSAIWERIISGYRAGVN